MGTSSWNPSEWKGYSTRTASKSTAEIFSNTSGIHESLDPKNITVRESRDSDAHPNSTPILVFLDVTGSMGILADNIARKGLGVLMQEIIDRKPVPDPHVLMGAIGDVYCDRSPLQATQFETDIVITDQLENIWLEGGGGGNRTESYDLPWYFGAMKTETDSFAKRQKKGYLFTVGDEESPHGATAAQLEKVFGGQPERDLTAKEMYEMASRYYHLFHVVVEEGHYFRHSGERVMSTWTELMGQRVLPLSDHTQLAEVIVSAIQINEGTDHKAVAASWSGDTALVVANATKSMTAGSEAESGVVRL